MMQGKEDKPNNWTENSKFILEKLVDLSNGQTDLYNRLGDIRVAIAQLQVKSGVWGAIGGMIPALFMLVVYLLKK